MTTRCLPDYLTATASRWPARPAVVDPAGRAITYQDLDRRADEVAGFLSSRGIGAGERVGVVLPKSVAAVAALFGIMRAGAAYVPVDVTAPAVRGKRILTDARVRAVILDLRVMAVVPDEGVSAVVTVGEGDPPAGATPWEALSGTPSPHRPPTGPDDLAYILYTSGSTGDPKGVMLTHRNAISFVEWASAEFHPTPEDRFSSHAPFHFDLSVLDLYVSVKHGATLYLISESLGKDPKGLARFISEARLTVWYSTPSILTLLTQFGGLQAHDMSSLRLVLFAGEVFPLKHLRAVKAAWPGPVLYNLYGPTETNVCTFYRVPDTIPAERHEPFPIGVPCAHCQSIVLDGAGAEVAPGQEGLLYISGPSVFGGYWAQPAEKAGFVDRKGARWYNTGDVVRWNGDEGFLYLGRRDRMVKRRGYRIELGEIERALYQHPSLSDVAVVASLDVDGGVTIVAFVAARDGATPSIIDLKTFCAGRIPAYMSPDRFVFKRSLPRTSTDKIDYQSLRAELEAAVLA